MGLSLQNEINSRHITNRQHKDGMTTMSWKSNLEFDGSYCCPSQTWNDTAGSSLPLDQHKKCWSHGRCLSFCLSSRWKQFPFDIFNNSTLIYDFSFGCRSRSDDVALSDRRAACATATYTLQGAKKLQWQRFEPVKRWNSAWHRLNMRFCEFVERLQIVNSHCFNGRRGLSC